MPKVVGFYYTGIKENNLDRQRQRNCRRKKIKKDKNAQATLAKWSVE
jgi:hypothetical protein